MQVRQVESDQIVAEKEVRVFGKPVQPRQSGSQGAAGRCEHQGLIGVPAYCGKGADAMVADAYFEVQR